MATTYYHRKTGKVLTPLAGSPLENVLEKDEEWARKGESDAHLPRVKEHLPRTAEIEVPQPDVTGGSGEAPAAQDPLADLDSLKRDELNELAESLGVEDPAELPNRAAVIQAIREAS